MTEISPGGAQGEPDWLEEMSYLDYLDSLEDPDRYDLVVAYAKRHSLPPPPEPT